MTINAKATTYTYGTSGNDIINAQYLLGDLIDGLAGNDTITGLDGGDVLVGNNGHDIIHGLGGHDVLDGGAGRDQLFGGLGNDLFRPDTGAIGNDFMDGGSDLDTIDYGNSAAVRGVRIDLNKTSAQDTLGSGVDTIRNVEIIFGTNFNDTIRGSSRNEQFWSNNGRDILSGGQGNDGLYAGFNDLDGDTLNGDGGDDYLYGGQGADILRGGSGDDRIIGNAGSDQLSGGTGRDRFDFSSFNSNIADVDRISDFNGIEDLISIQGHNPSGNFFIGSNSFSAAGYSEIRVTINTAFQLVEVDVDGNGSTDMNIEVVGTTLVADDFQLTLFG